MSDCCWIKLTIRPEHRALFEELGFEGSEPPEMPDALTLVHEQANYACDSDLRDLAAQGIPFFAYHGPGGEYGDGLYACDGHRLVEVDCTQSGRPTVEVDDDGLPDADQLHRVHQYLEVLVSAKKAIGQAPPAGEG